ncbi:hypothetical protein LTR53_000895 [Teratosphaeriaceae sp. CCFEE 6253]|nr:hypothetical protein LTR53_010701 [Teratosphaeriaceae sp. CCFEE 6253]KAK3117570.1 hypothetical protein LTR53_000895 [Teratosphaeriaceae sp. CCFEE 6253]
MRLQAEGPREPEMGETRIRIAVMGVTGSGKSSFIQSASELSVGVGHNLHSFTSEVQPFEFEYEGHHVTLIDTPGFNDTTRSETEVLKSIADYLDFTYRNPPNLKLTGIIYLQSIMDPRMYGSSLRNLKMFKDLVGPDPLQNVVLATTRWGQARKSGELELAESKEHQLKTEEAFWAPMVHRGSRVARFEDTRDSALQLILSLVDQRPVVLQIQSELVDQKKKLIDTAAGNTVNEESKRLEKKYKDEIAQIQKEMDEALAARDHDVQEALKKSEVDFQRKLDKVHAEQDMLRYERRNETRRMQDDMEELRSAYRKEVEKREGEMMKKLGAQKLDFDETVARLKANEGKLREEQRVAMQQKINEVDRKDSKGRTGMKLVVSLLPVVGSVVLSLLGIGGVNIGGLF